MQVSEARRLTIFSPSFDRGGVERMLAQLARGLGDLGVAVDLVVNRRPPHYLDHLPSSVRVVELAALGDKPLEGAIRYLRSQRPRLLLSSKDVNNELALKARARAGVDTFIWFRAAIAETSRVAGQVFWKRWQSFRRMRQIYPQADGIIAVSRDLARDVSEITGIAEDLIRVAPNPVITPEMLELAAQPVSHPWLQEPGLPLILGIGRLARVKNFSLLIQAFARVRRDLPCHLLVLGEGRERRALERLAVRLGLGDDIGFPGFTDNPYAYLSRSRLFVSSSLAEGSPNALTEALALGTPVVATDCLSGPREILQDGHYGPLVPLGDANALAEAMVRTLAAPPPADFLRQAAQAYTLEASAREYAAILGLSQGIQT